MTDETTTTRSTDMTAVTTIPDGVGPELVGDLSDLTQAPDLAAAWSRTLTVLEDTVTPQQRAFIGLSRLDGIVGDTALLLSLIHI